MGRGLQKTLETGQIAPEVTFQGLDGRESALTEMLRKGSVLLAFYKASCPTCQLTLPYLDRLHGEGFQVYAISQDDIRTSRYFNDAFGIQSMETLIDPAGMKYPASNAFGITHVPAMFLVEPGGSISWSWSGFHRKQLEILAEKAGRPIFHEGEVVPEAKPG